MALRRAEAISFMCSSTYVSVSNSFDDVVVLVRSKPLRKLDLMAGLN